MSRAFSARRIADQIRQSATSARVLVPSVHHAHGPLVGQGGPGAVQAPGLQPVEGERKPFVVRV